MSAVKNGIVEIVVEMLKADLELQWETNENYRNIFMLAILHRRSEIFNIIFRLHLKKALINLKDENQNCMLHMSGMFGDSTVLDRIPGAALQMQRELQWFKELESIVPRTLTEATNKDGLTPRQLFKKNHMELKKEGERWMKDTSTSCTVVGALIITIMFAAAITFPGGIDQNTGLPLLLNDELFKLFIISDAFSLFSATTSVLMFLGILTSRYAEDDFLKSLPKKMIIGLSTLFLSLVAMMTSFSAILLIMLRGHPFRGTTWIIIAAICLASIPVTLFVLIQFPLLVEMFVSTYLRSIFDRKSKHGFN
ncbi:ankyrin repeat-containing protein ITN1-like [Juglans microcarpa x Juglans regia]|uniref:ankyrin repeat-containing protein ITN1-like n=1 Tax=Juglans microcarpa x Juglans regia TaxID=2249226 RepID=UPI001B7EB972|nr:ankyrin repeat-containing protein ITN1-like [Juglans microcarpa x Juglans regia]